MRFSQLTLCLPSHRRRGVFLLDSLADSIGLSLLATLNLHPRKLELESAAQLRPIRYELRDRLQLLLSTRMQPSKEPLLGHRPCALDARQVGLLELA